MSISDPFFEIQAVLFAFSGLLLVGSFIAHYTKVRYTMESGELVFSTQDVDERRRAPRMTDHSFLQLAEGLGASGTISSRLLNLSNTGACITCERVLKKDQRILGMLLLPSADPLGISARVIWSKRDGDRILYGIQFDSSIHLN